MLAPIFEEADFLTLIYKNLKWLELTNIVLVNLLWW